MSAATILAQAFGEGACLYETVLNIPKDAPPSQLRKAYYKKALQYHPDKISPSASDDERESAKAKFQAVSVAYTILSDPEKRAEYDESGDLYDGDEDDFDVNRSGVDQWADYFKNIFPTVTTADIDAFEVKYKCSDEEESDVLKYYTQFKGDLNKMLECVMLSSDVDKERWVKDYIEPAVERGDVSNFLDKVKKTIGSAPSKKRKAKGGGKNTGKKKVVPKDLSEESDSDSSEEVIAEIVEEGDSEMEGDGDSDESEEQPKPKKNNKRSTKTNSNGKTSPKKKTSTAKASAPSKNSKSAKKKSSSSEDDLIAQIRGNALARQSRETGFNSLMAGLEAKYGGSSSGSAKKGRGKKKQQVDDDDIPDDEFEKIQAKLMKNKRKK